MPQLTLELTGLSRTMLLTLRGRVEEQARPVPLFQDELAVEWLKFLPWDDQLERFYNQFSQIAWAVRAYQFDVVANKHISSVQNPLVVELGAGLSTRYHRVRQKQLHWIELDLPEVTNLRRQLDIETERHQFISSSVMDFGWMDALPSRPPESILFIAEGLLMYFEANQVQHLVNQMRQRFPRATLLMDLVGELSKPIANQMAQQGWSLQWYVKGEREAAEMGLLLVNVWSLYQLCPERWPFLLRSQSWIPDIRNGCLILETKLEPFSQ